MKQVDYLIIGQGISGSFISYFFEIFKVAKGEVKGATAKNTDSATIKEKP